MSKRIGRPPLYIGCKVEGCERKHWIRGYCKLHDGRIRRGGDPGAAKPPMTNGHNRYHLNMGVVKPGCEFCEKEKQEQK